MNPSSTMGLLEVTASTVLTGVLNYANTLLLGRYLTPNEYGQYAAITALFLVVTVVPSAVQQQAALEGARGTRPNIRFLIIGGGISSLGLAAITPWLSVALGLPSAWLLALAVLMPAYALLGFWRGLLQGQSQLRALALNWTLEHGLKVAITLLLWHIAGLEAAVIGLFASVVLALCLIPRCAKLNQLDITARAGIITQNASLNQLAQAALTQGDLLAAKTFLPSLDAGLYAGVNILTRLIMLLSAAVTTVVLPELARKGPNRRTQALLSLPVLLGAGLMLLSVLAGPELIAHTIGNRYAPGVAWLATSVLAATLYAIVNAITCPRIARDDTVSARWLLLTAAVQFVAFALWHNQAWTIATIQAGTLLALTIALRVPQNHEVSHVLRRF